MNINANVNTTSLLTWLVITLTPGFAILMAASTLDPDTLLGRLLSQPFFTMLVIVLLIQFLFARFTQYWLQNLQNPALLNGNHQLSLKRLNFAEKYLILSSRSYLNMQRLLHLEHKGQFEETRDLALRTLQRVDDETNIEYELALVALGDVAQFRKQYDVALDYYRRAVFSGNHEDLPLKELAVSYMKMGKPYEALNMIDESLALLNDPTHRAKLVQKNNYIRKTQGRAEAVKAWVLASLGHYGEATELLKQAEINIEGDYPLYRAIFHLYAGRAYKAMNDLVEARLHLQQASELDWQGIVGGEAREILAEMFGERNTVH